jgi:hypothetical protein
MCRIPTEARESFLSWKQSAQVRAIVLVIDNEPGDLMAIADETHAVKSLDADETAVGRVLSI